MRSRRTGAALTRVGFIGLGDQGGPIAERIGLAGFDLTVWARRTEVAMPFAAQGATIADSPEALAASCDVMGLCVVDDAGVEEIAARTLPHCRRGAILVIFSTVHPRTCRVVAARAASRGVDVLDAPVSGGADAARAGRLTVMLGGDAVACAAVGPLLGSFAATIVRLGEVGAGQTAKLVNNALLAANLALAAEALEIGVALGLDRDALHHAIGSGSGGSFALELVARLPASSALGAGTALLAKDLGLLADMSTAAGIDATRLLTPGKAFIRSTKAS